MVDQDLSEHITMRLASAAGLPVAPTQVMEFGGERCLVIARFDRYRAQSDGGRHRVHQEDALQALGLPPRLCRLDPDETIARVRAMADSLLAVLSDVVVNAAQQWDSHVPGLLAPRLEDHLRACRERL
jgi:hypothetical protein